MKKVSENKYFYDGIRKRIDELEAEGHYDSMEMATMIVNESIEADPVTPGKYTSIGNPTTKYGQLFYYGWTDLCIYEHAYLTFKEVYEYHAERNRLKETKETKKMTIEIENNNLGSVTFSKTEMDIIKSGIGIAYFNEDTIIHEGTKRGLSMDEINEFMDKLR